MRATSSASSARGWGAAPRDRWSGDHLSRVVPGQGHQKRRTRGGRMGQFRSQRAHQGCARGRADPRQPGGRRRMIRAKIVGMGAYAPKRVLTNAELEQMIKTSDEWIVQRSGIKERRIADENEAASDLATKAAQQALERANLTPDDV